MAGFPKMGGAMADEKYKVLQVQDKDIPVHDALGGSPSIFIDGMQGLIGVGGLLRVGLFQFVQEVGRGGDTPSPTKQVVGRLIMTEETARAVVRWLGEHLPPQQQNPDQSKE